MGRNKITAAAVLGAAVLNGQGEIRTLDTLSGMPVFETISTVGQ